MKNIKKLSLGLTFSVLAILPAFGQVNQKQQKALQLAKSIGAATIAGGSLYFAVDRLVPDMIRAIFKEYNIGDHHYRQFFRGLCGLAGLAYGLPKLCSESLECLPENAVKNVPAKIAPNFIDKIKNSTISMLKQIGFMETENEKIRMIAGAKSAGQAMMVPTALYGLLKSWKLTRSSDGYNSDSYASHSFLSSLKEEKWNNKLGFSYKLFLVALAYSAYQAGKDSYKNAELAITGKN